MLQQPHLWNPKGDPRFIDFLFEPTAELTPNVSVHGTVGYIKASTPSLILERLRPLCWCKSLGTSTPA